ncbi:unnamed protein product [Phaedon cochleariae]|uniref:MARVEL domain-containing protein n=1 Tax=Phaedon cochleariae TaxID=80249 RepID=A0A9P0GS89_PHACE|nr:unnamed protein product [Phaedon cochleariae]
MDMNLLVFQEPRGVMRILHLIFSICAFATISGYTGTIYYTCYQQTAADKFGYPFLIALERNFVNQSGIIANANSSTANSQPSENIVCPIQVVGDFSSDAKFFVTTGVLAMLYSLAIIYVYTKLDNMYKSNSKLPLYDFLITVIFGVLWLSSSAAWANGLTGLKSATNPSLKPQVCKNCTAISSSFSTLNISVIFGFLNFFLWAADLWFIYKETSWFQGNQMQSTEGI